MASDIVTSMGREFCLKAWPFVEQALLVIGWMTAGERVINSICPNSWLVRFFYHY